MELTVPAPRAREYILGYTCLNDVTARDLQQKDGQFTRAKSFDTFCPIGPVIETELDDGDLEITTRVNGEVRQHGFAGNGRLPRRNQGLGALGQEYVEARAEPDQPKALARSQGLAFANE